MNNDNDFADLRDQLRRRAARSQPASNLVAGSVRRARRIRRRRTAIAAVTAVVVAGGGIAGASALGGQWPGGNVPVAGITATPATPGTPATQGSPPGTSPSPTAESPRSPESSATRAPSRPASSPSDPPTSTPTSSDPSTQRSDSDDGSTTPAPPPPATSTRPPSSSSSPSSSGSPRTQQRAPLCTADETTITVAAGQGAAGHVEYVITMTNSGDRACTVHGYPGVSMVAGDDGSQVGAPADRDPDHGPAEPLTVQPGGTATASLWVAQADNYGEKCDAVDARGFRIYLPEERAAQFAAIDVRGCRNPDVHLMEVRPFVAG